jgi:hypothetical protein
MGRAQGELRGPAAAADDEEQYADRIATSAEELRARGLAMQQASPAELARLRARDTAMRVADHRDQVVMTSARCAVCDGPVYRRVDQLGDAVVIRPWQHWSRSIVDHSVDRIFFLED